MTADGDVRVPSKTYHYASQFNFTFDFSGGVQVVNSNRRSFTVGYKYHHISNGNTGTFNPGVDVQMVFPGFWVFR